MIFFHRTTMRALFFLFFLPSAYATEFKLVSIDTVPWAYFDDEKGEHAGIFPDIVREIENETGHEIKISLTPYARINRELEAGRQDCTMLIAEKERERVADVGELVFNMPMGVIGERGTRLNNYDDLYALKISVLRSLDITARFTNDSKLNKEFDTGYEAGLRKILHGRLNAIAGAIPTIEYLAREKGMEAILGDPIILSLKPIYLQCSKKSKNNDFIKDINLALKKIRKSGVLNGIVSRYWDLSL